MKNPTKYEIPINIITPIHIGSIDTFSVLNLSKMKILNYLI